MNFGSQYGSVVHYDTMNATNEISQRRSDVKLVSIDPVCSPAASTADEWVPIRPGTDAALILGMVNQLINEIDIYDADFLRNFTNAAALPAGNRFGPGSSCLAASPAAGGRVPSGPL